MMKIVSGGQTGVDRAALDAAIKTSLPHGGWCPRGRRAEDGAIDKKYRLKETPEPDYNKRTRLNVIDSDGSLILNIGEMQGGTALTARYASTENRPYLVVDLDNRPRLEEIIDWITHNNIHVLNVAGPRASKHARIYDDALELLLGLFSSLQTMSRRK